MTNPASAVRGKQEKACEDEASFLSRLCGHTSSSRTHHRHRHCWSHSCPPVPWSLLSFLIPSSILPPSPPLPQPTFLPWFSLRHNQLHTQKAPRPYTVFITVTKYLTSLKGGTPCFGSWFVVSSLGWPTTLHMAPN